MRSHSGTKMIPDTVLNQSPAISMEQLTPIGFRGPLPRHLRHSSATHLLEAGVHLRSIEAESSHGSPKSTSAYTHLTREAHRSAEAPIDRLIMLEIADVIRRAGPAFQRSNGDRLLSSHRKAFRDLVACRISARGGHVRESVRKRLPRSFAASRDSINASSTAH